MHRRKFPSTTAILLGAAAIGAIVGISTAHRGAAGPNAVLAAASDTLDKVQVTSGFKRAREPQAGDSWGGCNDARAAGTAPIYKGEPGYRTDMDGDGDGIACEPLPN